jgi:hypothetical protein
VAVPEYVLDSDVLIPLFNHVGTQLIGVGRLPIVIPEFVWNEVKSGKVGPVRAAFMTAIAGAHTSWDVTSAEHAAFLRLYSGCEARLGDGERAAIAYAHVHPDAIVVTVDQLALKRAVEHLRGRVLSAFGLLDAFVTSGRIAREVLDLFAMKYSATPLGKDHPPPLWL